MRRDLGNSEQGSFGDRVRYLRQYMAKGERAKDTGQPISAADRSMYKLWRSAAQNGKILLDARRREVESCYLRFVRGMSPSEVALRTNEDRTWIDMVYSEFQGSKSGLRKTKDLPTSKAEQRYHRVADEFREWCISREREKKERKKRRAAERELRRISSPYKLDDGRIVRPIPGFPGYHTTEDGEIWSLARGVPRRLTTYKTKGDQCVTLAKDNRRISRRVHTCVYGAWIGPHGRKNVAFIDGDRTNCSASNLILNVDRTGKKRKDLREEEARARHAREMRLYEDITLDDGTILRPLFGIIGYFASAQGDIYSLRPQHRAPKKLSCTRVPSGSYTQYWCDGKPNKTRKSKLVYEAYHRVDIGPYELVVHLDGDVFNDAIDNLQLKTRAEVWLEGRATGTLPGRLTIDDIRKIKFERKEKTLAQIGREFGITIVHAGMIRRGEIWTAVSNDLADR